MSFWVHLSSPTVAVQRGIAHAVAPAIETPRPRPSKRKTRDTLCGLTRARPVVVSTVRPDGSHAGHMTIKWPPYVEEMAAEGYSRCRECMRLSPGKPNRMIPEDQRYSGEVRHAS